MSDEFCKRYVFNDLDAIRQMGLLPENDFKTALNLAKIIPIESSYIPTFTPWFTRQDSEIRKTVCKVIEKVLRNVPEYQIRGRHQPEFFYIETAEGIIENAPVSVFSHWKHNQFSSLKELQEFYERTKGVFETPIVNALRDEYGTSVVEQILKFMSENPVREEYMKDLFYLDKVHRMEGAPAVGISELFANIGLYHRDKGMIESTFDILKKSKSFCNDDSAQKAINEAMDEALNELNNSYFNHQPARYSQHRLGIDRSSQCSFYQTLLDIPEWRDKGSLKWYEK